MNVKAAALSSLLVVLAACSQSTTKPPAKAEFLNSPAALQRNLPFSEAVRAGDLLFLAGQMGTDPATGQLTPGGLEPEARQAIENMKSVLERNGRSLPDLVKCTVFLADINEWGKFNEIYKGYFKAPYPARSALGVNGLARGGRLEIECIAYAPAAQS